MVYRIYVEKKPGFDGEAQGLFHELTELLGIRGLKSLRLLNRYLRNGFLLGRRLLCSGASGEKHRHQKRRNASPSRFTDPADIHSAQC